MHVVWVVTLWDNILGVYVFINMDMCECWFEVSNVSHSSKKIKGYYEEAWIPWMFSFFPMVLCQIMF